MMAMSLTDEDKRWIRDQLQGVVGLVTDVKESLEREIGQGFASITARFDNLSARLDRQAGLLQTGTRRIAGLDEWAEKVDKALEVKDRQIAELLERLRKLEQK
jgi:hypothetical protein